MLTPAVRTAAKNTACQLGYLLSSPSTPDLVKSYETGYCAGLQARAPRQPYPVPANQEMVRVLAPYLAEQVEVYHPGTGSYGLLKGLPYSLTPGCETVAEVEWYVSPETQAEDGPQGDIYARPGVLLPVLYDWRDLETLITLPDGKQVVTVAEALKLWGVTSAVGAELADYTRQALNILQGDYIGRYHMDMEMSLHNVLEIVALLHRYGFAVGLRPDQYERRVAGHDYRLGAPQVGKEVARAR